MPFAEWSDDLSVGIEKIDGQHQDLIQILNDLHDAYDLPDRQGAAEACLLKMREYMGQHFADEEQFMKEIGYPELQAQEEQHRSFADRVADYEVGQISSYTPYQDMLDFLKEWFDHHISTYDRELADYWRKTV